MTKIPCLKYSRNVNQGVIGWVPQKAGSERERTRSSDRGGKTVELGRDRS